MLKTILLLLSISTLTLQTAFSTDFPAANTKTMGDMTFKWKKATTNIVIQVEKSTAGFGAIGFGTSVMAGSNVLFFDKTSSGSTVDGVSYRDCKSTGHSLPTTCKSAATWTVVHSTADPTSFKIELSRAMDDSDTDTYTFADGSVSYIWAQGTVDQMASKHTSGNVGTGTFTLPEESSGGGGGQFSTDFPAVNSKTLGDMTLKWKKDGSNIVVQAAKSTAGFGAVGFGTKVMAGSNIIFFDKTASGSTVDGVTYRDCKSTGHSNPSQCKSNTWTIVHSEANASSFKIELSRAYSDSDADTYNFADGTISFIWAQGSTNTMTTEHTSGNFGAGTFILPEGTGTIDDNKDDDDDDDDDGGDGGSGAQSFGGSFSIWGLVTLLILFRFL